MKRLTSDHPKGNFETMMNIVYGVDGWQYIRDGENGMPTTDFCLKLCEDHGCVLSETIINGTQETKDEWLCECLFDGCHVATVYAALSGFGHVRDRLKRYEDAGMVPPERENADENCR